MGSTYGDILRTYSVVYPLTENPNPVRHFRNLPPHPPPNVHLSLGLFQPPRLPGRRDPPRRSPEVSPLVVLGVLPQSGNCDTLPASCDTSRTWGRAPVGGFRYAARAVALPSYFVETSFLNVAQAPWHRGEYAGCLFRACPLTPAAQAL